MNVIVVGVDHSEGAKAALVFAHEEALLRHATLRAVHVWQYGYIGYTGFEGAVPAMGADIKELRAAAGASAARTPRRAPRTAGRGETPDARRARGGFPEPVGKGGVVWSNWEI